MKNQVLQYVVVVIIGIAIGVPIAVFNATKPIIIKQLNEISAGQKDIQEKLAIIETVQRQITDIQNKQNFVFSSISKITSGQQAAQRRPPAIDPNKVYTIPVDGSPVKGKMDAPITIVEFTDFQCPFCSRFHPVLNEVIEAYPNDVRYILKNYPLPFHKQARPAAKAALAAGEQGKYWEMAEKLLGNQKELTEEKFEEVAKEIGLNVKKFLKDYKDRDAEWEKIIEKDISLGQQVDVRGTPTFFLNGKNTRSRTLAAFKAEIDQILNDNTAAGTK